MSNQGQGKGQEARACSDNAGTLEAGKVQGMGTKGALAWVRRVGVAGDGFKHLT